MRSVSVAQILGHLAFHPDAQRNVVPEGLMSKATMLATFGPGETYKVVITREA